MIVYTLQCSKGHTFEEWFNSISDYESKVQTGGIACPDCGDGKVTKSVMAPHVSSGARPPEPSCGGPVCGSGVCPMEGGG